MDARLRKLGIELPIIQAPMADASTPEMAAAVQMPAGLGSLGLGSVDAETTRQMIAPVRVLTDRPFQVNVFRHRPAIADAARQATWLDRLRPEFTRYGANPPERLREVYQTFLTDDAKLAILPDERPAVVSFHFGLPGRKRSRVRELCCWPRLRISQRGRPPPWRGSTLLRLKVGFPR